MTKMSNNKRNKNIMISIGITIIMFIANIDTINANISNNQSINKINKVAYLTIDDGPSKYTDDILNILDKYNAKATFFMIDKNMKTYPDKVKSVIQRGNSVGLHSVSHNINELYKDNNSAKEEFERNKETFYQITGQETKLIRLPYGSKPYTSRQVYNVLINQGYNIWDWNIDTQDWKSNSEEIIQNVKQYSKNQNEIIILIHEKKQTLQALDSLLNYLSNEGYVLLAINQNQEPKNFWMENLYKN